MLIYNYKKEFLGIDEVDLKTLGLSTLADLRAESADFADLFVKTPGCIHNFKHVHWIDYVLDKNGAEAKVIIHVKNKNYSANLNINTAYLVDSPSQKAFSVVLSNIKQLSSSQTEKFLTDINEKPAPTPASGTTELFTIPSSIKKEEIEEDTSEETSFDPYESSQTTTQTVEDMYESEIEIEDLTSEDAPVDEELETLKYQAEDEKLEVTKEELEDVQETQETEDLPQTQEEEIVEDKTETINELLEDSEYANYVYNPEVASEELGLPIDLIEEFIQDFIAQALSFKDEFYKSVQDEELDTIKIQSHKLKGVAANLRIEDALDILTTINVSTDYDVITKNLNIFYIMIDKLSGNAKESIDKNKNTDTIDEDDDEFILSFKEDNVEDDKTIKDSDVPSNISILELEDDSFLASDVTDEDLEIDLSILDGENDSEENTKVDNALEYDKELIANDIGIDIESFNTLFDDYIKESKELINIIKQSADNNDLTICKNLASKLKGMSENMRIHEFDSNLDDIVNTTDTKKINDSVEIILSKLTKISE